MSPWRTDYDAAGRLVEVRHYVPVPPYNTLVLQGELTVHYYYDANPLSAGFSQYVAGRLGAVTFNGAKFAYQYSYNQAGRVTGQRRDYRSSVSKRARCRHSIARRRFCGWRQAYQGASGTTGCAKTGYYARPR